MIVKHLRCLLLAALLAAPVMAADVPALEPFAFNAKFVPKPVKLAVANQVKLKCTGAEAAARWTTGGVPLGPGQKPFALDQEDGKEVARIFPRAMAVGQTFVSFHVPDDQTKVTYNYVAVTLKSTKSPVQLSVSVASGFSVENPGPKIGLTVQPGEAQRIILPLTEFPAKGMVKFVGFSIDAANADSDVLVSDTTLGTAPITADYLKAQHSQISLTGAWAFATDDGERGLSEKWFAPGFDDSKWKQLKSGMGWQEQGVAHAGWGWYRQKIAIPKESAGTPLTIALAEIQYEDDVYFNGVHIGGLTGNYKYGNYLFRNYSVPAALVKYGENNTIAVRVWGINGSTFGVSRCGLTAGIDKLTTYYVADLDPYALRLRRAEQTEEVGPDHFDMSDAQRGMPFDVVMRFPAEVLKKGPATLHYTLNDYYGQALASGVLPVTAGKDQLAQAVIPVSNELSQTVYLRGRFKVYATVCDSTGVPVCMDLREADRLSFAKRDALELPALPEKFEETPLGKLKLIDEIDASTAAAQDSHPYMHSGGDHKQDRNTPGAPLEVKVSEVLGKPAREIGQGFFAYRIGRGKLTPHHMYLLRVEYPEDKPRYCPMEIQCGHSYMDIGWKNGVAADDPYDNWPLSKTWQWYDAIFPLDEETVGTSGTGGASAEQGGWIYFQHKPTPGKYFQQYQGGPAIARIKLYELDMVANAPKITLPTGLPQRTLMFDWERQADQPAEDLVKYAKMMGYNAISPIMLKWGPANYGDPISGFETVALDRHRYWVRQVRGEDEAEAAGVADDAEAVAEPGGENGKTTVVKSKLDHPSQHREYLAATKKYGINYVPRIEYGGSTDLPIEARAIGRTGDFARPNRFNTWGANLLHPATWTDLQRTVDGYFKAYAKDNPQLAGMLWRIRCDRMQISYGRGDIEMFAKENKLELPDGTNRQLANWVTGKDLAPRYADWWHAKRAAFHAKLAALLRSYRPDMVTYYYNWDGDKFSMGPLDMNSAAAFVELVSSKDGVAAVYQRHVAAQRKLTGEDYVEMIHSGQLFDRPGLGQDYALRTELYRDIKGFMPLAPANQLYSANSPVYLNYFATGEGLAVSNVVSYDEMGMRTLNPKFEGNMVTPGGPDFAMALEVLAYFHGDAKTLTYTVYTYGRGFADAHRRFAQAFLALPAVAGTVVSDALATADANIRVRRYETANGAYLGVASKDYAARKVTLQLKALPAQATVVNLVTGEQVAVERKGDGGTITLDLPPMCLQSFLVK